MCIYIYIDIYSLMVSIVVLSFFFFFSFGMELGILVERGMEWTLGLLLLYMLKIVIWFNMAYIVQISCTFWVVCLVLEISLSFKFVHLVHLFFFFFGVCVCLCSLGLIV